MTKKKRPLLTTLAMLPMILILPIVKAFGLSEKLMHTITRQRQSPKQKQKAFADYQPTQNDVFVCTYSKSGTNWTMQIAHQIAHFGNGEFDNIYDEVPWPDNPMPIPMAQLDDLYPPQQVSTGQRAIKTHLESDYVPYHPDAKYIIVIRDPKDVFVSSYFFGQGMINMLGLQFSPKEWLDAFQSDHFFFDSWAAHTASFWPWRTRDNVLVVTFGEMKRDLPGVVQQIAALMGVELTEVQLTAVLKKASFDYMKAIDHKFMPRIPSIGRKQPKMVMVRSGKSGASGELINQPQQVQIDQFCQQELQRMRSDFPYKTLFPQANVPSVELDGAVD